MTTTPERIQLRRTRGWRLPDGAMSVAFPTRWANPYRPPKGERSYEANLVAVEAYRRYLLARPELVVAARRDLVGRSLACWCPPGVPCHADVLLQLANGVAR